MIENIILKAAIFEQLNTIYKTQMYHELMIQQVAELNEKEAVTSKEKYLRDKSIKDTQTYFKNEIRRVEKYNNEVSKIVKNRTSIIECIENYSDIFNEVINGIIANPEAKKLKQLTSE